MSIPSDKSTRAARRNTPATILSNRNRLLLAGDRSTGLLHVGLGAMFGQLRPLTTIPVAPLLELIAERLNIDIYSGPVSSASTYKSEWAARNIYPVYDNEHRVIVEVDIAPPEAQATNRGSIAVTPTNARVDIVFGVMVPNDADYHYLTYIALPLQDVLDVLAAQFNLTVVDDADVLTRHLRDPLPTFEVFPNGTTAPIVPVGEAA